MQALRLFLFVFSLIFYVHGVQSNSDYNKTVEYYTNVVIAGQKKAFNYELPTDASMYKGDLSEVLGKLNYNFLT